MPDPVQSAILKPDYCSRKMLSYHPEFQKREHGQSIGEWVVSLKQNLGFPVLVLENCLSNGSGHYSPNFVTIQFHPLSEDAIFRFPGFGQRPAATLGELNFLIEREGLPKIFNVDLESVFDDWRQASQQLTMERDDFGRLYQYFQGVLEESLAIPVSFYERETCIFYIMVI